MPSTDNFRLPEREFIIFREPFSVARILACEATEYSRGRNGSEMRNRTMIALSRVSRRNERRLGHEAGALNVHPLRL
jgi:hypothetical protein